MSTKPDRMRTTIGGHSYQIGRLSAMQQTHVGRRIAPLIATLGISLGSLVRGQKLTVEEILPSVGPLTVMLASMKDDEVDYVVATALSVVQRGETVGDKETWAPVSQGALIMYADIDLLNLWRIVFESIRFSMADFLMELLGEAQSISS